MTKKPQFKPVTAKSDLVGELDVRKEAEEILDELLDVAHSTRCYYPDLFVNKLLFLIRKVCEMVIEDTRNQMRDWRDNQKPDRRFSYEILMAEAGGIGNTIGALFKVLDTQRQTLDKLLGKQETPKPKWPVGLK